MNLTQDDLVTERFVGTLCRLNFKAAREVESKFVIERLMQAMNAPGYMPGRLCVEPLETILDAVTYDSNRLSFWKPIK